jgi:xanthine dehydrogenase small subunit
LETLRFECNGVLQELSDILSVFGSKQIRNLATIGGNIAAASPIGDTLPLLMALGQKLHFRIKQQNVKF